MTAALPWTSVGVAKGYRGNPRVSPARATAHGASTANATVVATARAAVLFVTNSVVPTMATQGSPRQLQRQFPRTSNHSNFHGHPRPLPRQSSDTRQWPRKSAAVATAIPRTSNHSNFHGHPRQSSDTRQLPRKSTAIATEISMAFRGHPRQLNCHGNRRQFP